MIKERRPTKNREAQARTAHALAFGVAFLGVAFFLGVVAFFVAAVFFAAGAFFVALGAAAAGALVLVTRPDLVLPRTRETSSSTAGAAVGAVLRGLLALALGLAAGAALVVAAAVVVFFGRPTAFLGAAFVVVVEALALVTVAFLVAGAFFSATFFSAFFSAVFFSVTFFSAFGSDFLVAVAVTGLASFFASFTGPDVPLGRAKSPFSSPEVMARLT
jgi:hypothetical protein